MSLIELLLNVINQIWNKPLTKNLSDPFLLTPLTHCFPIASKLATWTCSYNPWQVPAPRNLLPYGRGASVGSLALLHPNVKYWVGQIFCLHIFISKTAKTGSADHCLELLDSGQVDRAGIIHAPQQENRGVCKWACLQLLDFSGDLDPRYRLGSKYLCGTNTVAEGLILCAIYWNDWR